MVRATQHGCHYEQRAETEAERAFDSVASHGSSPGVNRSGGPATTRTYTRAVPRSKIDPCTAARIVPLLQHSDGSILRHDSGASQTPRFPHRFPEPIPRHPTIERLAATLPPAPFARYSMYVEGAILACLQFSALISRWPRCSLWLTSPA